jgi:methylmalonyl-CoA/ethylmalonyl-CoA epimerase
VISRVDHIGIAVRSLQESVPLYRAIGLQPSGVEEIPSEMVRVTLFAVGETRIELLEPTTPESPIARFIAKRGEGLHHICLEVEDIRVTMAELSAQGFRLLSEEPKAGANARQVCFIHPKSAGGVLIELCEVRE